MVSVSEKVLLVSSRLYRERAAALEEVFRPTEALHVEHPGAPIGDLRQYAAVVLDGAQDGLDAQTVGALRAFVEAGGSLLAIGATPSDPAAELAGLLGALGEAPKPRGELFGKNAQPEHELLRRVDAEFPVVDSFGALRSLNGDTRVLLQVSWGLQDHPAVLERHLGGGRVVVAALGNTVDALRVPALRTLLRRALRPRNGATAEQALGVGIVGYGRSGGMGLVHGTAVQRTPGLRLVAACDQDARRREAARADFPDVRVHAAVDELVRDSQVDIVFVATPPVSHAAISLAALRAGKHVVCEKPLCLSAHEADELLAAAHANGVVLTVHQNRRWDPDFLAVRHALETGALGELFSMETFVGDFAHPCRYWHSDALISGGAIYDWGSHHIDWILLLMTGLPATVTATAHKRVWHDVTNFDQVRVRMLWADGREAEFCCSDVAAIRKPKFYLQGTAGTLSGHYRPVAFERIDPARGYVRDEAHFAEAPAEVILARYESGYGVSETRLALPPPRPFAFHRNLADHLHLGEALAVTPESVRQVVSVLEAANRSALEGGAAVAIGDRARR